MSSSGELLARNGQRIFVRDSGPRDAPAILFSHGFLMDGRMFDAQRAALEDRWRVISFDSRCFGRTEYDGQPFTYWDLARDALAVLDALGVQQAVLAGMSQGGYTVLRAALLAPQRVRALALFDTQAGAEDPAKIRSYRTMLRVWKYLGPRDFLLRKVARLIINDPQQEPVWMERWRRNDRRAVLQAGQTLLGREDLQPRLPEITCPVLVVHGTADAAIPLHEAQHMAGALPHALPVVPVEGAGHAACMTHPAPANAALLAFLGRLAAVA